jgi:hypothetical protein
LGLYKELVSKLEKLFGHFDAEHKRFEESNNSVISRALGYSDSQFSRLINETATEGEYHRAIQNVDRILTINRLEAQLNKSNISPSRKRNVGFISLIVISIASISILAFYLYQAFDNSKEISEPTRNYTLQWAFESNFINPYKGLRDLPSDCDYQCYKYQGRWELKKEYKLPFLRETSGFHYLAKSVTAFVRCTPDENPDGKLMDGYEYQEHEIWYDLLQRPIRTFISEDGVPLDSYEKLDFSQQRDFVKIGTIHSFYTNDFTLDSTLVFRRGQDIGRDIEFVSDEELAEAVDDKSVLERIKREMTQIAQDPLRDFSQPSACDPATRSPLDFHSIANGDVLSFNCKMTTAGRFLINYNKTYMLKDQFIKDLCVSIIQ